MKSYLIIILLLSQFMLLLAQENSTQSDDSNYLDPDDNQIVVLPNKVFFDTFQAKQTKLYKFRVNKDVLDKTTQKIEFAVKTQQNLDIRVYNKYFCKNHEQCQYFENKKNPHITDSVSIDKEHYLRKPSNFEWYLIEVSSQIDQQIQLILLLKNTLSKERIEMMFDGLPIFNTFKVSDTDQYEFYLSSDQQSQSNKHHIQIELKTEIPSLSEVMRMRLVRSDNPNVFWDGTNDIEVRNSDPNLRMDTKYHLDVRVDKESLNRILDHKQLNQTTMDWNDKSVSDKYQIKYVLVLSSEKKEKIISLHHATHFKIEAGKSLTFQTYLGSVQNEQFLLRIQSERSLQINVVENLRVFLSGSSIGQYSGHSLQAQVKNKQLPQEVVHKICNEQVQDKCTIYTQIVNDNKQDIFIQIQLTSMNVPKKLVENMKSQFAYSELTTVDRKFYFKVYKKKPFQVSVESPADILRLDVDYSILTQGQKLESWKPKYQKPELQNSDIFNINIDDFQTQVNSILVVSIRISRLANREMIKQYIEQHNQPTVNVILMQGPIHVQIPSRYKINISPNTFHMFYLDTINKYNSDKDVTVRYEVLSGKDCTIKAEYYSEKNKTLDVFQPTTHSYSRQMNIGYQQFENVKKLAVSFRSEQQCQIQVQFQEHSHITIKAQELFSYNLLEDRADQDQHFQMLYTNYFHNSIKVVFLNIDASIQDIEVHIKKCTETNCEFKNNIDDHIELKVKDYQVVVSNKDHKDFVQPFRQYLVKIIHKTNEDKYLHKLVGQVYIDDGESFYRLLFKDIPYQYKHQTPDEVALYLARYDLLLQNIVIRFNVYEGRVSVNPIYMNPSDVSDKDKKASRQFVAQTDEDGKIQGSYYLELDSYMISRIKPQKPTIGVPFIQRTIPIIVMCEGYCKYQIQETLVNKQTMKFGEVYNIHENQFIDDAEEVGSHVSKHQFILYSFMNKNAIGQRPIMSIQNKRENDIDLTTLIEVYVNQYNRSQTIFNDKKSNDDDLELSDEDDEDGNLIVVNSTRLLEYKLPTVYSDVYEVHAIFNNKEDYARYRRRIDNEVDVMFSMKYGYMELPQNQLIKRSIENNETHDYMFETPKEPGHYRLDLQVCAGTVRLRIINVPLDSSIDSIDDITTTYELISDEQQVDIKTNKESSINLIVENPSDDIKAIYQIEVVKVDQNKVNLYQMLKPISNINMLEFSNKIQIEVEPLKQCRNSQKCKHYDMKNAKVDYMFTIKPSDDLHYGKCGLSGNDLISLADNAEQTKKDIFLEQIEDRIENQKHEEKIVKGVPLTTNRKHIIQRFINFAYEHNVTFIKVKARLYDVYEMVKIDKYSMDHQKVKLNDILFSYSTLEHTFDIEEQLENSQELKDGGIIGYIFSTFWRQCLFWMVISFYLSVLIYCFNRSYVRRTMIDQSKLQSQIDQLRNDDIMTDDQTGLELRVEHKTKGGYQEIG